MHQSARAESGNHSTSEPAVGLEGTKLRVVTVFRVEAWQRREAGRRNVTRQTRFAFRLPGKFLDEKASTGCGQPVMGYRGRNAAVLTS